MAIQKQNYGTFSSNTRISQVCAKVFKLTKTYNLKASVSSSKKYYGLQSKIKIMYLVTEVTIV